jgi:molybdopterin/thiamine biosynthesis adenylyltransferase
VITTALPFEGEDIDLHVVFPFDYPDVEPMVLGPPRLVDRHQNRRVGNFCLLADPAADWGPGMAAAQLIDEDLRWLLEDSAAGAEAVAAGEADMPEPLSQHITATEDEVVIIPDPFWTLDLQAAEGEFVLLDKAFGAGHVLASADGFEAPNAKVIEEFTASRGSRHVGRWIALEQGAVSPWPTREELLEAAVAASPDVLKRLRRALARERKRADVGGWIAITFLEEGPHRGRRRRGWVLMRVRLARDGQRTVASVVRALALTADERARRIPELTGLAELRVLVIGAGSLGAPIIFELVKAGVGWTDVADYDTYDVNNAVRHVLDPRWAGVDKNVAVTLEARALNPFVTVTPYDLHVGGGRRDSVRLDRLLTRADIVVDATGSQTAARVLQRRCREFGKTLVLASLTAGSYGGEVAVFSPTGPCYYCFVLGQQDGTVPTPPQGPLSNTTPVGCSTPAFSGAGYDATAVAALAARTIIQASGRSGYPGLDHDYVVVAFRGDDPWRQGTLATHTGCPLCT